MASSYVLFALIVCLISVKIVCCNEDTMTLANTIDTLFKSQMQQMEDRTQQGIEETKSALRAELSQELRDILMEISDEDGSENNISMRVMLTDIRHLKRGYTLMKKHIRDYVQTMADLRKDLDTYTLSFGELKRETDVNSLLTSCLVETKSQKENLAQCKKDNKALTLNIADLNEDLQKCKNKFQNLNQSCYIDCIPSTGLTTINKTVRNRILVSTYGSSDSLRFMDMTTNVVKDYWIRELKYICALAYISKEKKLIIATWNPDQVLAATLDSVQSSTLRDNVVTWGIAVDETRNLIFMTTTLPNKTLCRMSTDGSSFKAIVDLTPLSNGSWPRGVAVDVRKKKVYLCNEDKLLMVNYDGSGLEILAEGVNMFAVYFYPVNDTLYFNDGNKVMTFSTNDTVEIASLDVVPWNLVLYADTLYFSSSWLSASQVGGVYFGSNTVVHILQDDLSQTKRAHIIALIP